MSLSVSVSEAYRIYGVYINCDLTLRSRFSSSLTNKALVTKVLAAVGDYQIKLEYDRRQSSAALDRMNQTFKETGITASYY